MIQASTNSELKHKLHPRTGFMTVVPGIILLSVIIGVALTPHPGKLGVLQGLAAVAAINYGAVAFALWSDRGHAVMWDDKLVCVRQPGGRLFFRRYPFVTIPLSKIHGLNVLPPPRGVPPRYPLLEIDAPTHREGPPLHIDPNYFTRESLAIFVNVLCEQIPEMRSGPQAKVVKRLLKLFMPRVDS